MTLCRRAALWVNSSTGGRSVAERSRKQKMVKTAGKSTCQFSSWKSVHLTVKTKLQFEKLHVKAGNIEMVSNTNLVLVSGSGSNVTLSHVSYFWSVIYQRLPQLKGTLTKVTLLFMGITTQLIQNCCVRSCCGCGEPKKITLRSLGRPCNLFQVRCNCSVARFRISAWRFQR